MFAGSARASWKVSVCGKCRCAPGKEHADCPSMHGCLLVGAVDDATLPFRCSELRHVGRTTDNCICLFRLSPLRSDDEVVAAKPLKAKQASHKVEGLTGQEFEQKPKQSTASIF